MIPERVRDQEWNKYAEKLAAAAAKAYRGAEAHDLKAVSEVSDKLDGICAEDVITIQVLIVCSQFLRR